MRIVLLAPRHSKYERGASPLRPRLKALQDGLAFVALPRSLNFCLKLVRNAYGFGLLPNHLFDQVNAVIFTRSAALFCLAVYGGLLIPTDWRCAQVDLD